MLRLGVITMKNSVKQMLRTPWKTGLFCLMIILSVALVVVGLNLWRSAEMNLKQADAAFVTIGTVQQRKSSMRTEGRWDAGLKDYEYISSPVYGAYIPITVFQLDDIDFIYGPEQRPFYSAHVPDSITYKLANNQLFSPEAVIEFVPVEDCVPSEPVEVDVINILYTHDIQSYEGRRIKFCDHHTEHPNAMERGKTYIAYVHPNFLNTEQHKNLNNKNYENEYMPYRFYTGKADAWEEVYEGFYETADGKRWLNFIDAQKKN